MITRRGPFGLHFLALMLALSCGPADVASIGPTARSQLINATADAYAELQEARGVVALVFPPKFGVTNRLFYGIERSERGYESIRYSTSTHVDVADWKPLQLGVEAGLYPFDATLPAPSGSDVRVRGRKGFTPGVLMDQLGPKPGIDVTDVRPRSGSFTAPGVVDAYVRLVNAGDRAGRIDCRVSWANQDTKVRWKAGYDRVAPTEVVELRGIGHFARPLSRVDPVDVDCKGACAAGAGVTCEAAPAALRHPRS
ncbi:MAG: hypothetical protein M3290_06110 [Actinomycetota bacterium]|nr:hypothetical protein [Actinomycetota bacterium]